MQPDDRLQVRDVQRRHDEIPVAEHHRAARAAEQRDRAEKARDGQQRHQSRRVARHVEGLQRDADEPGDDRRPEQRRPDRREHPADGGPVDDERGLGDEERRGRGGMKRAGVRPRPACSANPIAMSSAAVPALKRKNFTPASRPTQARTRVMPTPRWTRNRNRIADRDIGGLGIGD